MIFLRGRRATTQALAGLLVILAGTAACGTAQASAPASSPSGQLSARDRSWLNQAHQADMAEIAAGQFAQATGTVAAIRSAGATLVSDHTTFDAKLTQVASELKVSLVTYLTVQQTEIGDRLSAETGPGFDHDFTASMMTGHQAMIAATEAEILHGSSPLVTGLARQALPVLDMHLRMLRAVAGVG